MRVRIEVGVLGLEEMWSRYHDRPACESLSQFWLVSIDRRLRTQKIGSGEAAVQRRVCLSPVQVRQRIIGCLRLMFLDSPTRVRPAGGIDQLRHQDGEGIAGEELSGGSADRCWRRR